MGKRTYKPWTACARHLDPILAGLHAATPLVIDPDVPLQRWVMDIPFHELKEADRICEDCRDWSPSSIRWLCGDLMTAQDSPSGDRLQERLAAQIAMRIYCAQDLARRGPPSMQRALFWSGDLYQDLCMVLIVHWHRDAFWWAADHGQYHVATHRSQQS